MQRTSFRRVRAAGSANVLQYPRLVSDSGGAKQLLKTSVSVTHNTTCSWGSTASSSACAASPSSVRAPTPWLGLQAEPPHRRSSASSSLISQRMTPFGCSCCQHCNSCRPCRVRLVVELKKSWKRFATELTDHFRRAGWSRCFGTRCCPSVASWFRRPYSQSGHCCSS